MSFILDALRKSDDERNEQATPALAPAPGLLRPPKRNPWIPVFAVILGLNLLLIGYLVFKQPENNDSDTVVRSVDLAAPGDDSLASDTSIRRLRKEPVPADPPETMIDAIPPTRPVPTKMATSATATRQPGSPTANSQTPTPTKTSSSIAAGLPSFDQLRAQGVLPPSDLRLDMHVYANDSSKRFIFVNMKKYKEGQSLSEGPALEEITPTGAILSQNGQRFTIDRN